MIVQEQARAFAAMAFCGACAGAANDVLWLLRKNAWLTAASDLALGVLLAAGVIAAALHLRCEAFRGYTFLGVTAGWTIYAVTLGGIVRILRRKFINLVGKVTK